MKNNSKKILVGIDYTKSSENALNYALFLAAKTKAEVILFHAFEFPIVNTYSGIFAISYRDIKSGDLNKMKLVKEKALKAFPKANISILNSSDPFEDSIKKLVNNKKISSVVLGLGTKSKISKMIYGSHGIDISAKINCPLIIVPEKYTKYNMSSVSVCVDNQGSIKKSVVNKALKFTGEYKAKHKLVHIRTEDEYFTVDSIKASMDNKKWNVEVVESRDYSTGLKKHLKNAKADAVVVFSHSHSAFYKLFNNTNTKQIAFESAIPVISIHAK